MPNFSRPLLLLLALALLTAAVWVAGSDTPHSHRGAGTAKSTTPPPSAIDRSHPTGPKSARPPDHAPVRATRPALSDDEILAMSAEDWHALAPAPDAGAPSLSAARELPALAAELHALLADGTERHDPSVTTYLEAIRTLHAEATQAQAPAPTSSTFQRSPSRQSPTLPTP